ncbi:MAG TPA: Rrf2 family transcriptional regulator [Gemmataceae bacterium]|nr:Rrf2 family transcriptional regulator [Gemmataceae bacterium]
MTLLSRKADYALLILSLLHQRTEGATARAIADKFELSRAFVANILKELCKEGFVVSHRGVKGGYALARDAASISLAELLESIEEGFHLAMCNSPSGEHEDSCSHATLCTVKGPMAAVHSRLIDVLRGVTLAELFGPRHDPRPSTLTALPMLGAVVETPKI